MRYTKYIFGDNLVIKETKETLDTNQVTDLHGTTYLLGERIQLPHLGCWGRIVLDVREAIINLTDFIQDGTNG